MSDQAGPRWRCVATILVIVAASFVTGSALGADGASEASFTAVADLDGAATTDNPGPVAGLPAVVPMAVVMTSVARRLASQAIAPALEPLVLAPKTSPPRAA